MERFFKGLFGLSIFVISIFTNIVFAQFESGEHIIVGDNINILFPKQISNVSDEYEIVKGGSANFTAWLFPQQKLHNKLSYGTIVAIPDFYANSDRVISDGVTLAEQKDRFKMTFDRFHQETTQQASSVDSVLTIILQEVAGIKEALAKHQQPSEHYPGGGWIAAIKTILVDKDELPLLLKGMIDHFGGTSDHDPAWLAYNAGHEVAIETAIQAYNTKDSVEKSKLLVLAYARNGYACHFLSDRFAAGHMRVPFKKMRDILPTNVLALLLINKQHDEDNAHGLEVTNKRGDKWTAYGDKRCYDDINKQNREILAEAMQKSADEIAYAFNNGSKISLGVEEIIVDMNVLTNFLTYVNNPDRTIPMFAYYKPTNDLLRRDELTRLHPTTQDIPFEPFKMRAYGKLMNGWLALPTFFTLLVRKTSAMENCITDSVTDVCSSSSKELNEQDKKLLSEVISNDNGFDKHIICTVDPDLAKELTVACPVPTVKENINEPKDDL
ncbi:hypothetical protein GAMM_170025 [Gammaproteobacteria bacterium]